MVNIGQEIDGFLKILSHVVKSTASYVMDSIQKVQEIVSLKSALIRIVTEE